MFDWILQLFRPNTVNGILKDIYAKLDQLEMVSERSQGVAEYNNGLIEEALARKTDALNEAIRAESVARRLRELIA